MFDAERRMLAHNDRSMGNQAVLTFQKVVQEDPKLFIATRAKITALVYAMLEAIVRLYTRAS